MPRIIAGTAGGRRLAVPSGDRTRPSADRVKEALFSSLTADPGLVDARVLDLFAGSGALGLEAASRGARLVRLVESEPSVLRVLRRNVADLGLAGVEVIAQSVERHLDDPSPAGGFDLVLIDPPYSTDVDPVLDALQRGRWLASGAVVVCERATRSRPPTWPTGLTATKHRRYGDSTLWYGRRP